jgi:hypothetical protein
MIFSAGKLVSENTSLKACQISALNLQELNIKFFSDCIAESQT